MVTRESEPDHFNQKPRRKAEFTKPLNILRTKVGYGGLNEEILQKAQVLLESNVVDFQPMAAMYLDALMRGIDAAKNTVNKKDGEILIADMLYPAMQLKSYGGMFHYPLVTRMAGKLIEFLEVIAELDDDAIEIVLAFHTTMQVVMKGRVTGDGGQHGDNLTQALEDACWRYFERYPENRSDT